MIDYSGTLEDSVDMSAFCEALRAAAVDTGVFPMPGVRVRAVRCDHWSVADGDPKHDFIDISVRIRAGRSGDAKAHATQTIFAAAQDFLAPLMTGRSVALSLELREIDPDMSRKAGTIRDHLGLTDG